MAPITSCTVTNLQCVVSKQPNKTGPIPNFCTHVALLVLRVSGTAWTFMSHAQSRQLAARDKPPPASHPYLRCGKWRRGWCSEGGRGTGGNGKNISSSSPMLADGWRALRCGLHIRTAAATASQRGTRRGVREGREALCPRRRGLWQHHFFSQADSAGKRQAAGSVGGNCAPARGKETAHGVSASPLPCRWSSPGVVVWVRAGQEVSSVLSQRGGQGMCGLSV